MHLIAFVILGQLLAPVRDSSGYSHMALEMDIGSARQFNDAWIPLKSSWIVIHSEDVPSTLFNTV